MAVISIRWRKPQFAEGFFKEAEDQDEPRCAYQFPLGHIWSKSWRLQKYGGQWLFPNSGGNRYDPDNFSRDLRAANANHGLNWTNLDYRHTSGSQLAMKGESLYKISKLMGNSPEICRRHYAALLPESLIDSVEFGTMEQLAVAS